MYCVSVCYEFGFVVVILFTGVSVMDVFVLLLLLLLWPRITGDVNGAGETDMCWDEGVRLDSDSDGR